MSRRGGRKDFAGSGLVGQLNWAVIDQGLSSGTNFALALIVVRSVTASSYGAFSILVIVYILAVGAIRAVITEPMMIRSHASDEDRLAAERACIGAAFGIGCVLGVGCLLGAATARGGLGASLAVLGVTFPLLLVQDAGRGLFFARKEPKWAAFNDGVWSLLQFAFVALVIAMASPPLWCYAASWLGSGAIAGAVILSQIRVWPSVSDALPWLRSTKGLGIPLFWNFALTSGPHYLVFAIAPLFSSLRELGLARTAFIPFGILGLVLQSAPLVLLPAASRRSVAEVKRLSNRATVLLAGLAVCWGGIVLSTPRSAGIALLGHDWPATRPAQLAFAFMVLAQAAAIGPAAALRALERPRVLVRVRLVALPVVLVLGVVLAARYGAVGTACAVLSGEAITVVGVSYAVSRIEP
jgi:O-antigen/teichoic acid export membrane protein